MYSVPWQDYLSHKMSLLVRGVYINPYNVSLAQISFKYVFKLKCIYYFCQITLLKLQSGTFYSLSPSLFKTFKCM